MESAVSTRSHSDDHEVFLLVCFGGMSNTGYLSALAAMEAVKRVGLRKAGIACLAGVPSGVPTVMNRVRNAKKVITVDGCPTACARKLAENAGLPVTKSIVLASDCGVKKIPLREHLDLKDPTELITKDEIERATEAIVKAIQE